MARWLPVGAAGGLLAIVIGAGVLGSGGDGGGADADGLPSDSALTTVVTETTPATTIAYEPVESVATVAPVAKVPLTRTLSDGVAGDDVQAVQQRLADLGFDPGPIDGIYGLMTMQSVWAFEALVMDVPREDSTGKVSPEVWDRMQDPIKIKPRRPTGGLANHTEVYLDEQVLAVFHADQPVIITHISSGQVDANGEPKKYCEEATYDTDAQGRTLDPPETRAICALAKTPGGVFTYRRMVEGRRVSPLGGMYDPVYFNYGIAVHGAQNVPNHPDSHGCVRIPMHISEYYQDLVAVGERILVWNGEKEPEAISLEESYPSFDYPDPDATTTTSSTTTTTTTTTVPDTTIAAAPETTSPTGTTTSSTTTTSTTAPAADSTTSTTQAPPETTAPDTTTPSDSGDDVADETSPNGDD